MSSRSRKEKNVRASGVFFPFISLLLSSVFSDFEFFGAFLFSHSPFLSHAFFSFDAEARALCRIDVGGGVAALDCDSSATKCDINDDDIAPKLAINILLLPIDVSTFPTPPRRFLFLVVLVLFGIHLGL